VRNWGARLRQIVLLGYPALVLESPALRVTVLAGRGGDVVEFLHKPTDTDFCTFAARGLRPAAEVAGRPFLDVYYGGWQEVFPSGGAPCRFRGAALDQHAEVALLPWRVQVLRDDPQEVAVALEVRCLQTPFTLRREMRLAAEGARLVVRSTATHTGRSPHPAMWGQHLAFGAPYAGPGCRITLPAEARVLPGEGALDLAALGRAPEWREPSSVSYLTGFREGRYVLRNPARPVGLEVRWDASVLPYLWCWREAGASADYPWYGRDYLLGLEPFSSYPTLGLAAAADNGSALTFGPGESRCLEWSAAVVEEP
jgi:hypothetical protein